MSNYREIKDDILKEWFDFREDTLFCFMTDEDKKHSLHFDAFADRIMRNVPDKNRKFVEKQIDSIYNDFMSYLYYYNEKYYSNGFIDGVQLVDGFFEK